MKVRKYRTFVADFETTVFKGQTRTDVWASAIVELNTEDVKILHSIEETFDYMRSFKGNLVFYYHNLKFDGSFWLDYLITVLNYKQAYIHPNESTYVWLHDKEMENKSFRYSISDRGQWYTISIKVDNRIIEFRDSLKLLPFSVKKIGDSFKTKHKKLDMEYTGFRYPGCEITDEEKHYIANDVLVVKEALEIMFEEGHNKLTIGTCCLDEFKKTYDKHDYETFFPNIYEIPIDKNLYGAENAGEYVRRSYRGGWCYLVEEKAGQIKTNGTTADVNSLYPSMMSSESGNYYPVGKPTFWKGDFIPDIAINKYYFVRIKCRFQIKPGYLPFIQIKNSFLYRGNVSLRTSDVLDENGNYCRYIQKEDGTLEDTIRTMTLTMTDFELLKKHYYLSDFQILDGCWFYKEIGIFDTYMNKYKKIKMESKGAIRELAKLFLNNLYGKEAASTDSSFKVAYIKENGALGFISVKENEKKPGYIPCGSAITSYSRAFTITAAQKNYHGINERGFIYADTDSIHCDLEPDEIIGIVEHPTNFCSWKLESCWDKAFFTRQKTYIEHITKENREPVGPHWDVKCAGMSEKCKKMFIHSVLYNEYTEEQKKEIEETYNEEERKFIETGNHLDDFNVGLEIPGKLIAKRVPGGVLLVDTTYKMR